MRVEMGDRPSATTVCMHAEFIWNANLNLDCLHGEVCYHAMASMTSPFDSFRQLQCMCTPLKW